MTELREFARRSSDFEKLGVRIIGISVDNQEHAREAWEKAGAKKFTILSDPSAKVIRQYGLLHEKGHGESDIALRTTLLVDPEGRERWSVGVHAPPAGDVRHTDPRVQAPIYRP